MLPAAAGALFIIVQVSLAQAAFLNFGGGPKNAALGDTVIAQGEDVFAAQLNPALLSMVRNSQFEFEYQKLFSGLSGPETDVPGYRSVNVSVSNLAFGIPFRRLVGSSGLSYLKLSSSGLYDEEIIQLHLARTLNDLILKEEEESLGLGLSLKFLKRSVEPDDFTRATFNRTGNSASAFTLDLGAFYKPLPALVVGLSLRDLLTADVGIVSEDPVPKEVAGGISWSDPIPGLAQNSRIVGAISRREGELRTNFHVGVEAAFSLFTPRLGFNRDEFATGFGIEFKSGARYQIFLDYAFVFPLSVSGTTGSHRTAIRIDFAQTERRTEIVP